MQYLERLCICEVKTVPNILRSFLQKEIFKNVTISHLFLALKATRVHLNTLIFYLLWLQRLEQFGPQRTSPGGHTNRLIEMTDLRQLRQMSEKKTILIQPKKKDSFL